MHSDEWSNSKSSEGKGRSFQKHGLKMEMVLEPTAESLVHIWNLEAESNTIESSANRHWAYILYSN